jgi:hypothetical protein
MPYRLKLYWRDNVPGDIVEATDDEIHSLLVYGLAEVVDFSEVVPTAPEEVTPDAVDTSTDAGRGSDGNDVPPSEPIQ